MNQTNISFMGGNHYSDPEIVDLHQPTPPSEVDQSRLRASIAAYKDLYVHDYAYCQAVQGAALEENLWVVRNRDASGLSEADLRQFKNIAWNEFIVKRFMRSSDASSASYETFGASLLDVIRNLNLQWHTMEVS